MNRPVTIITGACGGMGQALARTFGRTKALALSDIDAERLKSLSVRLKDEGYAIAAVQAGDIALPGTAVELVRAARAAGRLHAVVHTAGVSPALAPWDRILLTNLVGAERILVALEERLEDGLVTVLIASMAGHMAARDSALDTLLADPLAEDLFARAAPLLDPYRRPDDVLGLAGPAYAQSKRAVIRMCESRAGDWGRKGARIVSISPGTIWTSMGRKEAESNPRVEAMFAVTPAGRRGTALDIAAAAAFLASDEASFITGCDLRIDGGLTPFMRTAAF
jgi:NAD(P)-dependent dehydrogenase (short-subunit alcohol dehydrogenase family)